MAFPFSSASTDVFSRAIEASLFSGSMTRCVFVHHTHAHIHTRTHTNILQHNIDRYKAEYKLRNQDMQCVETLQEGGNVMDIKV